MTDTPTDAEVQALEARVAELEQRLGLAGGDDPDGEPAASRRDVLAAAATAAGVGILGSYGMSGGARAQSYSPSGALGSQSSPLEALWSMRLEAIDALRVNQRNVAIDVPASGSVDLVESQAYIDTGISDTDATYYVALGVDNEGGPCEVAARLRWDDSTGTYHIGVVEQTTSIANPTVNYDVVRVR